MEPIHMEVSSADASGGVAFSIYNAGSVTARTLKANERIHITDICITHISGAAGPSVYIYADGDAAGERVYAAKLATTSGVEVNQQLKTPYACQAGITPELVATAGVVLAIMQGYITQA